MHEQGRDAVAEVLELRRPVRQIRAGHVLIVDHPTIVIAAPHTGKITEVIANQAQTRRRLAL